MISAGVAEGGAGLERDGVDAAPQAVWGRGPGQPREQGHLTESHLIHGPLFLHAGHRRSLLLVLCGQRMRMKPRGAPGGRGGAGSASGRGQRAWPAGVRKREWGSEGPGWGRGESAGGIGSGALPPVLCPLTTLLLPGRD